MNDLMKMKIFGLLSGTSEQVSKEKMQDAYGESLEHIESVSGGVDYAVIHRTLNATRIENVPIPKAVHLPRN